MQRIAFVILFFFGLVSQAHISNFDSEPQAVLADLNMLNGLGIPVLASDDVAGVGYAYIDGETAQKISDVSHQFGKCGPFYVLPEVKNMTMASTAMDKIQQIREQVMEMENKKVSFLQHHFEKNPAIESAINQVSAANLKTWVQTLSNFPSRAARGAERNNHVQHLQTELRKILAQTRLNATVETVAHSTTQQNSLVVRIPGSQRPNEIVVLGAHLDSIVGFMGGGRAPGADDNGTGSSNLIEALRIFSKGPQPHRTIEIYFYAAEELGLVGSGEIAREYKSRQKDVVSVMQLDMTAFPGLGVNNIGSISDYTHPWLQAYLKGIVTTYLPNVTIKDFRCGYGCSDHASWFNEGYPSFAPFEADMDKMNRKIHTAGDVIDDFLNFDHSAIFSKIALVYLMDMANSTKRVE